MVALSSNGADFGFLGANDCSQEGDVRFPNDARSAEVSQSWHLRSLSTNDGDLYENDAKKSDRAASNSYLFKIKSPIPSRSIPQMLAYFPEIEF